MSEFNISIGSSLLWVGLYFVFMLFYTFMDIRVPATALLLSSILFAILHFNMVQSLSGFLCGIVLGLLYLTTDSVLCCIIAHSVYNILSCAAILRSAAPAPK